MVYTRLMLAKHQVVLLPAECISCMGSGFVWTDERSYTCKGCVGRGQLDLWCRAGEELDYVDGPAFDAAYDLITSRGAECDEDAWRYKLTSDRRLLIETYPVSRANRDAMNAEMVRSVCDRCAYEFKTPLTIACACGGTATVRR